MLKQINKICKIKQLINEGGSLKGEADLVIDFPVSVIKLPIKDESTLDFKNGEKLKFSDFKNYYDYFRKMKYIKHIHFQCLESIVFMCDAMKYSQKVSYTASTYYHRFFLKNHMLEYNPYHVMVICIFLANKTERGKVLANKTERAMKGQMAEFFCTLLKHIDQKEQEQYKDMFLINDTHMCAVYHLDSPAGSFDEYAYLKDLEIDVCRTLNFEFFVHNPTQNINQMQNILHDFFKI